MYQMPLGVADCSWVIDVTEEDRGNDYGLKIVLSSEISRVDLDVHVNNFAIRLSRNSAGRPCEIPLPLEVISEKATVKWHQRMHGLCFSLPMMVHQAVAGSATPDAVSAGLEANDHHVIDDFVSETLGGRIAAKVSSWYEKGRMKPGVVGTSILPITSLSNVRGDVILNLNEHEDPDVAALLRKFDALALVLSKQVRALQHVVQRSNAMVAVYPPGSCGYLKHVDNSGRDPRDRRRLTCICYLNYDWNADCSGALRLHLRDKIVDVAPIGGRFACFWADTVEHEVLPSKNALRTAVSVWYSEPLPSPEPERQLPIQAVHCLAAELVKAGAVKFPEWTAAMFSSHEFSMAAQALSMSFMQDTADFCVLSKGSSALQSALNVIRKAGTSCYHRASNVVANCICVAEHLLGMLVRSRAPGWEHLVGLTKIEARAVLIATVKSGTSSALSLQEGAALGCIFGLAQGRELCLSVCGQGQSQGEHSIGAGDVLLIHPSHATGGSWKAISSLKKPILRLEVWF